MKTLCNWPQSRSARLLTAMLVLTVFGTVAASVSEAQPPSYALSVSTSSNHSSAIALQGATLSGNVYVFTSSAANLQNYDPSGIAHVCYWLDNPAMTGTARHCESYMPYDFISSVNNNTNSPGNPWNTTPVANGTHTITQAVTKSAGGSEVDTATFSVQNATITLSATTLAFGSQVVGTTSAAETVTLTDSGTATVTFTAPTITGDYAVSNNTCGTLTTKGASCTISVTFTPTTTGTRTGTLTITDNANTSPQKISLSGTGNTNLPTIAFTANPTTIPQGQSSTLSWATTNATSVSITNVGPVNPSGTFPVAPAANTTYTLTATGAGGTATQSVTIIVGTGTLQHFEYVVGDQNLYVYDLDNNFQLLKHVSLPQVQGIRGLGAVPSTNTLYISYGYDGQAGISIPGSLLAYDLLTDTVLWTQTYSFGVDSFAITPDGTTIYMPSGVSSGQGIWHLIDLTKGGVYTNTEINTGGNGAHDTVVSLNGSYVFMGLYSSTEFVEGKTSSNTVSETIGGLKGGVSPFTVNGANTLAFVTHPGYFGFEVLDLVKGTSLYPVPVGNGFSVPAGSNPDHGISLSPDESEIYLIDTVNGYAHVFDVSGLSKTPRTAPTQVYDVKLNTSFAGNQSPCLYDCQREGWIRHTRDGQYVIVGDSGDVISTSSIPPQVVGATPALPALYNTRVYIEIDWQKGVPISTTTREGLGYVTQ